MLTEQPLKRRVSRLHSPPLPITREPGPRLIPQILGEADRLKISISKDPMGLAASALYIACVMNVENRTQKMIAEAAGVTEVTIRNRYTELKRVLNLDRFKPEDERYSP